MPELKMKPTYKIFILDEDEYNDLHKYIPEVKKEDLKDSLGFAHPKIKECYIKRTGVKELDDETIIHEAEELLAKHSSHEDEQNIRWKKGGAARYIVPAILSLVPGVGPILAAASNVGMNQYAQSRHPEELGKPSLGSAAIQGVTGYFGGKALAGGVSGGIQGGTAAEPGLLSKAGGIVSGAAKGTLTGSSGINTNILGQTYPVGTPVGVTNTGKFSQFPGASPSGLLGAPLSTANQILGIGQSVSGIGTTLAQAPKVGIPTGVGTSGTQAPISTTETIGKSILTPTNILGGAALLGSQAPKTPQFEMPSYVSDLRSKLMAGETLSPLGQQARTSLSEILKAKPQELYPTANDAYFQAATRRTEEAYAQAQKQLDAAYNLAGVYGSGEHLAEKAKLEEQLARTKSGLSAEIEQRRFELARNEQYKAIQDSLGVDRDTMDDIAGITGLDVQTAAMMYGAQVQDVQSIREALGTLGAELLVRGIGGEQGSSAQGGVAGTVKSILGQ